jgi:long-subunit fatty acid transport protein
MKTIRVFLVVLVLILFTPKQSLAQDSDLGNWLVYIGSKQLNQKWNLHHEIQYRNYDVIGDLEQLLLRVGLGHTFNNKSNLLLGYGYILSENYLDDSATKSSVNEHRIFQQFITKQKLGKLGLQHRYRFEQRFVESDYKMRFRYFLGLSYPLYKFDDSTKQLYASAYNEIFLNTEPSVFDRNRLYGGLGFKFNSKLKVELGYMNQFFENSSRDQINIITFYNF